MAVKKALCVYAGTIKELQSGDSLDVKLDDLAAPDDNTDLNVSSSAHGLYPKLSGSAEKTLMGDGNQVAVARINTTDSDDDDFKIAVVSALPGTPDANTLYFVTA